MRSRFSSRPGILRWLAVGATLAALATSSPAEATVVEKIVAVVGDDAVLLTEVRTRCAPILRAIAKGVPTGPQRTAAESDAMKEMLGRMVNEILTQQAADRLKVTVTQQELDKQLAVIAGGQKLTVAELIRSMEERSGFSEIEYRAEIRRQMLEGKLLSQRVRGRLRITEEDLKNAFARAVREERELREYRVSWIVLKIPADATPAAIEELETKSKAIREKLSLGETFADLAAAYSDDPTTREKGGDLGVHAPIKSKAAQTRRRNALAKEIEERLVPLEPGEFTDAFRFQDAFLIMGLTGRAPSRYTTYDAAKEEMAARVQNELLLREKTAWLEELKKRTFISVRL
jgi:peptidyl-prolyl cis-trans isomerase SurA